MVKISQYQVSWLWRYCPIKYFLYDVITADVSIFRLKYLVCHCISMLSTFGLSIKYNTLLVQEILIKQFLNALWVILSDVITFGPRPFVSIYFMTHCICVPNLVAPTIIVVEILTVKVLPL